MKKLINVILFFFLGAVSVAAQTFEVDTLVKNGPVRERINLVFMGDGYTEAEQAKYITDVEAIMQILFLTPPFKQYKSYFNVFAIKVISQESGANHPKTSPDQDCAGVPQQTVNNYFGSTFDYGNIHRLLYPTITSRVVSVLTTHFPLYDQGFLVVNSPYYGGAGGAFATCSVHPSGQEVAIHEIGHSFAGLADEYWAGSQYAAEKPNMTQQTNAALVKWKNWMGTSGVGIYPHSGDASWKKPHENCKMERLSDALCPVCTETFVEKFHQHVKPLWSYSPSAAETLPMPSEDETLTFSVDLIKPEPNTLSVTWRKNNMLIASGVETLTLAASEVLTPTAIQVTVVDNTSLQRSESHSATHVYTVKWQIGTPEVVTGIEPGADYFKLSAFPNPVKDQLNYSFTLERSARVKVDLLNAQGMEIKTLLNDKLNAGTHHYAERVNRSYAPGEYLLRYTLGDAVIVRKLIFAD